MDTVHFGEKEVITEGAIKRKSCHTTNPKVRIYPNDFKSASKPHYHTTTTCFESKQDHDSTALLCTVHLTCTAETRGNTSMVLSI